MNSDLNVHANPLCSKVYSLPLSLYKRLQLFLVTLSDNPQVVSSVFTLIE